MLYDATPKLKVNLDTKVTKLKTTETTSFVVRLCIWSWHAWVMRLQHLPKAFFKALHFKREHCITSHFYISVFHTVRNLHFFVQKFNFDFPRKSLIFFGWKTRENVVVLYFLAVDNFDFTRKIVKKIGMKNSWKCWVFCQNWIFGQKIDFSNSVNW